MATKPQNILIFGATGLIGEFITNSILQSISDFGKVVIFTSENTVQTKSKEIESLKSRGAEIITGDVTSPEDIKKAYNGIDTVVSCVGRPVIDNQILLLKLADEHSDVKRFFPSEYGTDIEYGPSSPKEPPHQLKLKVRAAMKEVKNLEYTYLVTGPYADGDKGGLLSPFAADREAGGGFDVKQKRAVLLGATGNDKISMTTKNDVGKLVVAALKHPEASRNRALKVNSFTATPKEVLAEFEKQTGGKSWEVSYSSLEQLKELEQKLYAEKHPMAVPTTLRRIWTEGGTLYKQRDNGLIGMEDGVDSLADAVKQAIKVQTQGT